MGLKFILVTLLALQTSSRVRIYNLFYSLDLTEPLIYSNDNYIK